MKKLKKVLLFFFAPNPFKIGMIITASFVYLSTTYYGATPRTKENQPLLRFVGDLDQKTLDYRMRFRGPKPVSDNVALVTIDENAVEKLGRWPWPRSKIADMIERLKSYGAKTISFDAVFSEPESNSATKVLTQIKASGLTSVELNQIIDKELEANNSDVILAKTVEKHADSLVMGTYYDPPVMGHLADASVELCENELVASSAEYKLLSNEERPAVVSEADSIDLAAEFKTFIDDKLVSIEKDFPTKPEVAGKDKVELAQLIAREKYQFCTEWLEAYAQTKTEQARNVASDEIVKLENALLSSADDTGRWWMDVPVIAQGTKHTGYFNAYLDKDGTARSSILVARYGDKLIPSLALKTVMLAKNYGLLIEVGKDPANPGYRKIASLTLTDPETAAPITTVPVDGEGRMLINYAGDAKSFPHMSVAELFNGKDTAVISQGNNKIEVNKAAWIKDKIFLFGATAIGIYDLRITPFSENFPGPEIHTNIIDNLLTGDFLYRAPDEHLYMAGTLLTLGLLLSGLIAYLGAVVGLLISAGSLAGVYFYDHMFLFPKGVVTSIIFPILMIGTLYVVLTFYKYLTEERKKKELKGTFAKYVSPSVVNEILKHPENIELGGKKQRMTVMFSDVRGFTTISEKLEPTKLGDILNMYLTPMTRLVFEYKGTLDKYMGDAIMAFWGAPIAFPDHAVQACRCALKMMERLKELNQEFAKLNLPAIDIGIGINTGDMSVGNMGSDIVRSYTVMGDSVNLGSRLEGINKEYGTHVIISEFTYQEVKDQFVCREVDWVRVKGKNLPVKIYELISEKTADEKLAEKIKHFQEGFNWYHEKVWDKAVESFHLALNVDPDDYASKLYVKRCTNYQSVPPPEDWDGVFEMKTK